MLLSTTLAASLFIGMHAQLVAPRPRLSLPQPTAGVPRAAANENSAAAGAVVNNVLTIAIDVVESAWHPEGLDDPDVPIFAFVEAGKAPQVPGPLVRVRQGTSVRLVLRSRVDSALVIWGLRPRVDAGADSVHLAPGAHRELRYQLDSAGSYFYWGAFKGSGIEDRLWLDSQLNGAIIVDAPGASTRDHVFVLSEWFHPYDSIPNQPFEVVSVINGKGWPHTQRLTLTQGDSTRFRLLNAIPLWHPMHLHGFFYRVESRGTWGRDGPIAAPMQPMLNTDLLAPGGTMTFSFVPTTPGNWLMHCHFSFHMDETVSLSGAPRSSSSPAAAGSRADEAHHMRGLVVGIQVQPAPNYTPYSAANARQLRLLVQKRPNSLVGGYAAYGFVLQRADSVPKRDSVNVPGPVLDLVRGEPVRINVVNNLDEPTGIHWHGLEIESFPDGVPHWSGLGEHVFKPIAPGDSFVAAFTPPRSGTYPYHSHLNERHQIASGMYGAIIVSDTPRDLSRDHVIVAGGGGPEVFAKIESPYALVNGRRSPRPLRLTAGDVHRLRILAVHPDWRIAFTLRSDSSIARWRAIAKDGADLPAAQATERTAHVEMGPGETADFEFAPRTPGRWLMEIKSVESGWYIPLPIIVTDRQGTNRDR